jgi:hypothetical protein
LAVDLEDRISAVESTSRLLNQFTQIFDFNFLANRATFFTQNGNQGACGKANPDSAVICALFTSVYAGGKHCGKQISVTNLKNGKTAMVTVADECPTCNGPAVRGVVSIIFYGYWLTECW